MTETSLSLLERLRDRSDAGAWQRLVDLYTPLIHSWLSRQGVAPPDLDDLVQDVLVVLVRELPRFQHSRQRGAFRHWLRAVTVNRLRGYWRAKHAHDAEDENRWADVLDQLEDPSSALSVLWDAEHDQHVVHRLLQLLRPEFALSTWQAFRGVVLEERPAREVAADLGLSVNAVLIAKSRVLQRLRRERTGLLD